MELQERGGGAWARLRLVGQPQGHGAGRRPGRTEQETFLHVQVSLGSAVSFIVSSLDAASEFILLFLILNCDL